MSSAGPRATLWLNQRPRRGCVFTQIWFPPSNSPFSASPGQENHQDCEKMIPNFIPKQNSIWKVQISRGEPRERLPRRQMRKPTAVDPTASKLNTDSYFRETAQMMNNNAFLNKPFCHVTQLAKFIILLWRSETVTYLHFIFSKTE